MSVLSRTAGFLKRVIRGEDVVLVFQDVGQWDAQFSNGSWARLVQGQPNTDRIAELIFELADATTSPIRVLDVGCGNGGLAKQLGTHTTPVEYVGIDISRAALDEARQQAPVGTFLELDAASPSPDLGMFDVIVFNEVLYYLDPSTALPRYGAYAEAHTVIIISAARSWRSPFVWNRIGRWVQGVRKETVRGKESARPRWDILIGRFRRAHS